MRAKHLFQINIPSVVEFLKRTKLKNSCFYFFQDILSKISSTVPRLAIKLKALHPLCLSVLPPDPIHFLWSEACQYTLWNAHSSPLNDKIMLESSLSPVIRKHLLGEYEETKVTPPPPKKNADPTDPSALSALLFSNYKNLIAALLSHSPATDHCCALAAGTVLQADCRARNAIVRRWQ